MVLIIRAAEDQDTRSYSRRMLEAAFSRAQLIAGIAVGPSGELITGTVDWWDYWRILGQTGNHEIIEACSSLRRAWTDYIESGFGAQRLSKYCKSYFALLDAVLAAAQNGDCTDRIARDAAKTTAAFECFPVGGNRPQAPSAATVTLRNPAYLLARAKWPNVPHSTNFLPLITLPAHSNTYSHYRRYPLSDDGDLSLLVYPRNSSGGDSRSNAVLASVSNRLGLSRDPYAGRRSQRLWEHVIQPLAEQNYLATKDAVVELVDIGSGTGALAAAVCERLIGWAARQSTLARLRVTLIDDSGAAPSKRFQGEALRRSVETLHRVAADYRKWLPTQISAGERPGLRVGLACKTFDMSSSLALRTFRRHEVPDPAWCDHERRSPTVCLSKDPTLLMVSPSRFSVNEGHTYPLASLSDYFAALAPLDRRNMAEDKVCLPVRTFDTTALVTDKGTSVFAEMIRFLDYVVIEDADLKPSDLLDHLRRYRIGGIRALDLTAAMGLVGNYAYLLWSAASIPPRVEGKQLM